MSCNSILKKIDVIDKDDVFSSKNFRKWALKNHPDKGGDSDIFAIVSNCVDEYNSPPKQFYNGPNPFTSAKKTSVPFGFRPPSTSSRKSSVRTPSVKTPSVRTPSVKTPSVRTPSVKTPSVKTPSVKTPSVKTPSKKKSSVKTPSVKTKSPKVCPEGKILNPKTNRCVNIKTKSPKVCPEGKILNPKTNRCVNKDGKIGRGIKP